MFPNKQSKNGWALFSLFLLFFYVLEVDALARFGGGRSFGSRGSRSYSAPRSPSRTPSAPSRQYNPSPSGPTNSPYQQRSSGGFLRGLAGGILGGMIGGMLFRGLGFGGYGGMGGGIGLFDIIIIGLILYGIWWFIKKKRQEAEPVSSPPYYREEPLPDSREPTFFTTYYGKPDVEGDVNTNLGYIRQMDPAFDEQKFKDQCMDIFFKIQGAWTNRDISTIRNLLTDEMYKIYTGNVDDLKRNNRINRLENIAVRSVEITEVWQESGMDFITVRFYANLLDYTIDESSGQVVSGNKTDPVKFEEYWTFTRPVGNNPWKLSAITQDE